MVACNDRRSNDFDGQPSAAVSVISSRIKYAVSTLNVLRERTMDPVYCLISGAATIQYFSPHALSPGMCSGIVKVGKVEPVIESGEISRGIDPGQKRN